jgi:hypothetical protein
LMNTTLLRVLRAMDLVREDGWHTAAGYSNSGTVRISIFDF